VRVTGACAAELQIPNLSLPVQRPILVAFFLIGRREGTVDPA
jgi:hypothetical protein